MMVLNYGTVMQTYNIIAMQFRNQKLQETDWYSNSDVTMPDNIKIWRQQLRDLRQTYTTEAEYDELLEMQGEFPNQTYKHTVWSKP